MKTLAQKHPIIIFLLINFAWTWLFWFAVMPFRGQTLLVTAIVLIGGFGPVIGGILTLGLRSGQKPSMSPKRTLTMLLISALIFGVLILRYLAGNIHNFDILAHPTLIAIGSRIEGIEANVGVVITGTLLISLIPAMMNAVIFAYVWTATQSLAVSSVYHSAYDEVRDAIEKSIGFGPLVGIWEMAATTIIGAVLLWKGNWKPLIPQKIQT